jgi:CrcB-like protein, Camphor Resistance (CrcB)
VNEALHSHRDRGVLGVETCCRDFPRRQLRRAAALGVRLNSLLPVLPPGTTFSTFSAEVVTLLQEGRFVWAMGEIVVLVIGSLIMTIAGFASWQALKSL